MGSSQSKIPGPVIGETLAERLRALEVRENTDASEIDRDFVYVEGRECGFLQGL